MGLTNRCSRRLAGLFPPTVTLKCFQRKPVAFSLGARLSSISLGLKPHHESNAHHPYDASQRISC
jgi:hypothetical protein